MPDRLSVRSTLLVVALAFGLAFAIQVLLGASSSAAKPAAQRSPPAPMENAPGAEPALSLAAAGTVPALRDPLQPRKRRKKKRPVPKTDKAARAIVPSITPRYVPPARPRSTPTPTRTVKPTPTPAPQTSGEFDSSGEP